jgi:hypothetical protein
MLCSHIGLNQLIIILANLYFFLFFFCMFSGKIQLDQVKCVQWKRTGVRMVRNCVQWMSRPGMIPLWIGADPIQIIITAGQMHLGWSHFFVSMFYSSDCWFSVCSYIQISAPRFCLCFCVQGALAIKVPSLSDRFDMLMWRSVFMRMSTQVQLKG